jgi:hypothetical protein
MDLSVMDIAVAKQKVDAPTSKILLVRPDETIARAWHGYTGPVPLGLAMREALGEPVFSQMGASR